VTKKYKGIQNSHNQFSVHAKKQVSYSVNKKGSNLTMVTCPEGHMIFDSKKTGIMGSNFAQGMDMCIKVLRWAELHPTNPTKTSKKGFTDSEVNFE